MNHMVRPCYLVIDREHSGSISTRKLVIETGKFNVITAYSSPEAIETLREFPNVSGIVLDAKMPDMDCEELVQALKAIRPSVPVIAVHVPGSKDCPSADHYLEAFDPASLLQLIRRLMPQQAAAIDAKESELVSQ